MSVIKQHDDDDEPCSNIDTSIQLLKGREPCNISYPYRLARQNDKPPNMNVAEAVLSTPTRA